MLPLPCCAARDYEPFPSQVSTYLAHVEQFMATTVARVGGLLADTIPNLAPCLEDLVKLSCWSTDLKTSLECLERKALSLLIPPPPSPPRGGG